MKKMKRNSLHLLKINNKHRKNNQKEIKIRDFEEKIDRIITSRIDSITRSGDNTNIDYDKINSLK